MAVEDDVPMLLNEFVIFPRKLPGPVPCDAASICSISSGGGEPDEGVEGDGEPGSGGEFIAV